ncbi:ATP-binding protein [Cyanobium gracile]|uniref:Circadian input-output histidine kinase CikA n=1 Tax=Cyanobium gracile (strain ATCC 27147 / PCC 6307) TaxID=292564 RepID=K9P398_CYAGP|nr:ATP-binding protein [Cyanobium gracile]AFY27565.1 signal transduction histidine kinase [Cyanobium gracile PCC 6307]
MRSTDDLLEQLRKTLGRLDTALSCVDDGLVITDFKGLVEWTNRAFDVFVGCPRLKSLGKELDDLVPTGYVEGRHKPMNSLIALARNGPGRSIMDRALSGPRQVMEVSWSPVNFHPEPSLVFVFKDLSEITRVQDALTASRDSLEEEVASRTRQLQKARDEAQAATEAMGEFLSTISHEIRTPMNAVIGMTDLLLDTPLNGAQRELVQTIHSSGELLLCLINDILDLSKIEAQKMTLRADSFSIRALVDECMRIMNPSILSKGLSLGIFIPADLPEELYGDSLRIRQILLNLMNNAVKFTDNGTVQLDLTWNPLSVSRLMLSLQVSDSGHGISPEFLPRIFNSFAQDEGSPNHGHRNQGTGLGLAICDRLCKLMGGRIRVESEQGKGSRFSVSIPLGFGAMEEERREESVAPATLDDEPSLRILVADDNRINQRVMELMLAKLDAQAEFVGDGHAAVERVQLAEFDLVFMDLQMPGMDGLEATRRIRASRVYQPYVVALTASALGEQQRDCLTAGMNDFLSKPVRLPDIRQALQRYRQWKQRSQNPMGSGRPQLP